MVTLAGLRPLGSSRARPASQGTRAARRSGPSPSCRVRRRRPGAGLADRSPGPPAATPPAHRRWRPAAGLESAWMRSRRSPWTGCRPGGPLGWWDLHDRGGRQPTCCSASRPPRPLPARRRLRGDLDRPWVNACGGGQPANRDVHRAAAAHRQAAPPTHKASIADTDGRQAVRAGTSILTLPASATARAVPAEAGAASLSGRHGRSGERRLPRRATQLVDRGGAGSARRRGVAPRGR